MQNSPNGRRGQEHQNDRGAVDDGEREGAVTFRYTAASDHAAHARLVERFAAAGTGLFVPSRDVPKGATWPAMEDQFSNGAAAPLVIPGPAASTQTPETTLPKHRLPLNKG